MILSIEIVLISATWHASSIIRFCWKTIAMRGYSRFSLATCDRTASMSFPRLFLPFQDAREKTEGLSKCSPQLQNRSCALHSTILLLPVESRNVRRGPLQNLATSPDFITARSSSSTSASLPGLARLNSFTVCFTSRAVSREWSFATSLCSLQSSALRIW